MSVDQSVVWYSTCSDMFGRVQSCLDRSFRTMYVDQSKGWTRILLGFFFPLVVSHIGRVWTRLGQLRGNDVTITGKPPKDVVWLFIDCTKKRYPPHSIDSKDLSVLLSTHIYYNKIQNWRNSRIRYLLAKMEERAVRSEQFTTRNPTLTLSSGC
jgi:hypothetical protein